MVDSLGEIKIEQIDAEGDPIETWILHNPIMIKCEFGSLAYGDDELVEVSTGFKYDWAEVKVGGVDHFHANNPSFQ